jgi:hypothetical protein
MKTLEPICSSVKCKRDAGLVSYDPKGVMKDIDKIRNDVCLDCGHSIYWKKSNYKYRVSRTHWKNRPDDAFRG